MHTGLEGVKLTDEEDAGNIWNIWALYRYEKLTGQANYRDAAAKAPKWVRLQVSRQPHMPRILGGRSGGNGRLRLSGEAYEFGNCRQGFGEMGDRELAVEAARNAITWIWTQVVECREYVNSYGHAHEHCNWPPAKYVAPMFGLAAHTAFRLTGDELF